MKNCLKAILGLSSAKFLLCVAVAMVANQSPWTGGEDSTLNDSEIVAPLFKLRVDKGLCQQMKNVFLSSFVL